MNEASVIICTHNPRPDYLARVLAALKGQTLPQERWELLLIDNASSSTLSEEFDLSWHSNGRHIRENKLGLLGARVRAFGESRGELVIFVDDDNILDSDYLEKAITIADECSFVGVFGAGSVLMLENGSVPDWTRRYWHLLAIREVTKMRWCNFPGGDCVPFGAGICVRRSVASPYSEAYTSNPLRRALGSRGGAISGDEDTDLAYFATTMGLGYGISPLLRLNHLLPAERLSEAYLLRLVTGRCESSVIVNSLHGIPIRNLSSRWRRFFSWLVMYFSLDARQRRFRRAYVRGRAAGVQIARQLSGDTGIEDRQSK